MFINEFENSNEYKIQQIVHTLKSVHGVELKLDESTDADLSAMCQSSEIIKNSIVSESQFNTYCNNPEYTKHILIIEAVRLYLTEIAPKRQKKTRVKENAVPSVPSTPSVPSNGSANTATPPGANAAISSSGVSGTTSSSANTAQPGMISVQKGTDKKTIPAAQLASLQSQGYTVVGDANAPVHEEDNERPGADGYPANLENLMQKYGVNGEVDEGMKEKIGGFLRRMGDKDRMGQSRADVVAKKANIAYAGGNSKNGDRYMSLINKGKPKVKAPIKAPRMAPEYSASGKIPPMPGKKGLTPIQLPTREFGRRGVAVAESISTSSFDAQASMARAELYRNTKYAMDMLKLIREEDDIQAWIASNLVKAAEYLDQIFHYLDYYTKFEPEHLPEGMEMPDDLDAPEELGETTGSIARENLTMIVEYSRKLFNMIQPGDKLEGWIAMKLTSASNAISNSKHYLEYAQFEKHAGDHIADMSSGEIIAAPLDEKAPMMKKRIKETLSVGQMLMRMMVNEDQDLAQAQALIAAKSLSDDLMTMAEKVSKMSVDDLMPLVDTLKDQFGPEAAEGYNSTVKQSLDALLQAVTTAKSTSDDAITQLQGGGIPGAAPMGGAQGGESPDQGQNDASPESAPTMPEVPSEPLGRARKEDELAEAWGTKMKTPEKKKGMWNGYTLAALKAKKKKLMDKEERSAKEQTLVKEIDFAIRAKQKNKWGNIKENDLPKVIPNGKLASKSTDYDKIRAAKPQGWNPDTSKSEHSELADLMKKYNVNGNTGDEPSEVTESKKLTERNKENSAKKKAAINPKKRPEKKNDFDIRNMKPPFKKKPSDTIKIKEATKKAKPDFLDVDKDGDKKESLKKAVAAKKRNDTKKKVAESAPPGKDAESFIKNNKASFAKRYGKKGEEVLYATAWKKFGKKSESVIATGKLLENNNTMLTKLEAAFNQHRAEYARTIKEGKHDDPLGIGYGLEGELLIKQMNDVKSTIATLKETLKREITKGAAAMRLAEHTTDKVSTLSAAKRVAPWGVAWKSQTGRNNAKFFESRADRDYWLKLKDLTEAKLINPDHFDNAISKISSKKV